MHTFIPNPIEDEWLFSIANRWWQESAEVSYDRFCHAAFGEVNDFLALDSIAKNGIRSLAGVCASPLTTIKKHSLLPFFRINSADVDGLGFLNGFIDRSRISLEFPYANRIGKLRCCELCMQKQMTEHGFSAWIRAHNLPGVSACWIHGFRLSQVTTSSLHDSRPALPHFFKTAGSAIATSVEISYARVAKFLLASEFGAPRLNYCKEILREAYRDQFGIGEKWSLKRVSDRLKGVIARSGCDEVLRALEVPSVKGKFNDIEWLFSKRHLWNPGILLVLIVMAYGDKPLTFFAEAWKRQREAEQLLVDFVGVARRALSGGRKAGSP